jgi:hypothetical protein
MKNKPVKIYIAGKMVKHSHSSSYSWRDDFLRDLSLMTGLQFVSFDPTRAEKNYSDAEMVFGCDVHMISQVDVVIVYFSDDISVGGSQEVLIAKYFNKPVIGLAPRGGKFNNAGKEVAGVIIKDYKHPFVFSTCDVVCSDIHEVADALKNLSKIKVKNINIIDELKMQFEKVHLKDKLYEEHIIK